MVHSFKQGYLDSLCGVYGLVNAEKIVNNSSDEESQKLFDSIIMYLSKKRVLKDVVIGGMNHRLISKIMYDVVADKFQHVTTNKKFSTLKEWWNYSKKYLTEQENRGILLSVGGREDHITVVTNMSDKSMKLFDSGAWGGINSIRKSSCKLLGTYDRNDKYIIYSFQTWYLG